MSSEKIIDCRGLACPQPVILTKKAIDEAPESLVTIVDNVIAKENVVKFATSNGYGVSVEPDGGLFRILMVAGTREVSAQIKENAVKQVNSDENPPVYLITRDTLGSGSDELGTILMKAFFVSLLESKPLPRTILFLNSGVRLAVSDSPVLTALQVLAGHGVQIMSCGTCLDYFHLKDKLAVGTVTNMFTILSEINGQGRSITL